MNSMFQHLSPDYQDKVLKRWTPVINAGGKINDEYRKISTAMVLENTQRDFDEQLNEAYNNAAFGGQPAGIDGGGAFDTYTAGAYGGTGTGTYGPAPDSRIPTIVIPTVRRIFPELLAHDVVGVQPMNGPVGFAFALRATYGQDGTMGSATQNASAGTEIGYNQLDSTFTGSSGNAGSGSYWQAYAGSTTPAGLYGNQVWSGGQGATLGNSEWAAIGTDMPMAQFRMEKGIVEAKTRKLAANWSLELAEDMKKMHGVDVDSEMVNILSYEIQAEIDRQLITEMVKAGINGGRTSSWDPVSADGRNQMERIGTLYTHILDKSNDVAIVSRRGPANFAIVSPKVAAILERLQDFTNWGGANDAKLNTNVIGVAKMGTLRQGNMTVYRDTFAGGNYALLGYKGPNPYDSGIIFCPYIPVQLMRAIGPNDFTPRIGARTRYGVLEHVFGSDLYYHFIKIDNLTSAGLSSDDSGSRIFTY